MFLFHDTLMQATRTRSPRRLLLEADLELDRLRLYVRLSHARALLHGSQYQYAAEQLSEIGRLLGGWLKSLASEPKSG
jgi:hypothetical protein